MNLEVQMKKSIFAIIALCLLLSSGMFSLTYAQDDKGRVGSLLITVPNVIGKTLSEAIAILGNAGLGRETQLSDRDGERRIVIRQDPAAGARVPRGTVVKIYGQLASADDVKGRVTIPRR
jgi:beta-lactam-binding protein with PASTA domain